MDLNAEQIAALRSEARAAGSQEWVAICDKALAGDTAALNQVAQAIDSLVWPWN